MQQWTLADQLYLWPVTLADYQRAMKIRVIRVHLYAYWSLRYIDARPFARGYFSKRFSIIDAQGVTAREYCLSSRIRLKLFVQKSPQ